LKNWSLAQNGLVAVGEEAVVPLAQFWLAELVKAENGKADCEEFCVAAGVTVPGLPRFETPTCCHGSMELALVPVALLPVETFVLPGVVTAGIE